MARKSQPDELVMDEPISNIGKHDTSRKYVYVLANKLEPRSVFNDKNVKYNDREYPRGRNVLLRSSIDWPGGIDPWSKQERAPGRYIIRYYNGCTTLFIDSQPQHKETIEAAMRSTPPLNFVDGYLEIQGANVLLKVFLDMASWNAESPYRVQHYEAIYMPFDIEAMAERESAETDELEMALANARNADENHMRIHARFLNIPELDPKSMVALTPTGLRAKYRLEAKKNPKMFNKTFNDKTILIKTQIDMCLENGTIDTKIVPNKASWKKTGTIICDISGIKSYEGQLQRLIEFSQTPEGEDFVQMLKSVFK